MKRTLADADRQEIVHLLRNGFAVAEVSRMSGRSHYIVREVQLAAGIPPLPSGRRVTTSRRPETSVVDEPEEEGTGRGNPWMPAEDYDLYAEKKSQDKWLALLAAARPAELDRLRSAMCTVLHLSPICTDEGIALALCADRRGADELAGLYMAARAGQMGGPK